MSEGTRAKFPERFVLCVDDDVDMLGTLADYLTELLHVTVQTATSVKSALRLIDEGHHFDVIVSDFQIPPENGDGFHRALRERGNRTLFALYSGFDGINKKAFEDDFFLGLVEKPESRKLTDLISRALERLA